MKIYFDTSFETEWGTSQWESIFEKWAAAGIALRCRASARADIHMITLADVDGSYQEVVDKITSDAAFADIADRLMVFDTSDSPLGLLPGLYCSLRPALFSRRWHRTGAYPFTLNDRVRACEIEPGTPAKYLFSFQGNHTSRIRKNLFGMDYGRDDVLIEKRGAFWQTFASPESEDFRQQYADTIAQSRFILCPRGIGVGSYRLYETMRSGRVPVILSDGWVPCEGIDWPAFSIRVREQDLQRLPEICESALPQWPQMARTAREVWETWFSDLGLANLIEQNVASIAVAAPAPLSALRRQWLVRRGYAMARSSAARLYGKIRG